MIFNVPPDKRIFLLLIAFSFGALLEGVAGFGTPVAICSALLVALGFPAVEAVTLTLMFNTTPVAFGALGAPVITLGAVTGLPPTVLGSMIGRQLPFFALILPFYALIFFTGIRSLRTAWPIALVAGVSFGLTQFVVSNFINYQLTDISSSLVSLACIILFVKVWKPRDLEQYRASFTDVPPTTRMGGHDAVVPHTPIGEENIAAPISVNPAQAKPTGAEAVRAWLPWLLIALVVIIWTVGSFSTVGARAIKWAGLHNAIFLTLYHKPYAAIYSFQPLGTGTAILVAVVLTALLLRISPKLFLLALADTWKQLRLAILTVVLIIGLAYLYNYSGMIYTLGLAVASVGAIYPFFAMFLGWIACFLTGSDTSANALFGNLQVVAAHQLKLSPVLMAATNSSGAVMGKMVSPQNVTTGVSTTNLAGKEGLIVRRTILHSLLLASLLGLLVMAQQYLIPWIIPH